ncbi:plastocyanin/azurin family copper-binding protein [Haloarcula salinisoli]|uniref:Halocyanin n=1 Tax=Haloarcula salinisoli TaxID=2487746 RepID=A0A8J7YJL7_9EURY|nr:plastocyanin/azurin family copper-binding protein [Halomicroarcula salinisoli]MBX0287860.1 halocyanin [Halomicroarcula salinisoli]MBX0304803.1 halocyanin [Halomicroarcula salinisoli]
MEESRRRFVAALSAGITGAIAGCGGSESSTPTAESTGTQAQTSTATSTATPEAAQVVAVATDGFSFSPASFEIAAGETVRWEWAAGGHNVKPDTTPEGSDWSGTAGSDLYSSGHTYSYTFEVAGEYSYYCQPHRGSGMTGSFIVTEQ